MSSIKYIDGIHGEQYCAGNVTGHFRRTSSLRLRGEKKMVQRSPISSRKFISVITENQEQKQRGDECRLGECNHRQRSHSFNSTVQRNGKSYGKISHEHFMDRKHSLSVTDSGRTPPGSPEELPDDDSLNSYESVATAPSVDASYAPFNGTTFSGRSMRYVLHCSSHAGLAGEEYLTPTQRAQKQIRKLKNLLGQAKKDLEKKDSEIFHLTKEVVELRLYKASLCSPEDKSNSSEIVTIRENAEGVLENIPEHNETCGTSYDVTDGHMFKTETPTHCRNEMQGSFTDSGHFDDLTNSSLHSKESILHHDVCCMTEANEHETERRSLIEFYDKKIEDVMRNHVGETQELKKVHNDKVEALLQKLSDVNSRYCELLPNYEQAKEKILQLEKQLEELSRQLKDNDTRHGDVYLQMYNKGIEAGRLEVEKDGVPGEGAVSRVSVEELLEQLQITQTELENVRAMYRRIVESQKSSKSTLDPEVTLQFLKSAIYYFLTDPENHQGHLNAIENILGFSDAEKSNIRKARTS